MEVPKSCAGCFEKQIVNLESAGDGRRVVLCPLLALLALNTTHRTPPIERHFLNLAGECATETHGDGGLYRIQEVQGTRAVEALVTIKEMILASGQELEEQLVA